MSPVAKLLVLTMGAVLAPLLGLGVLAPDTALYCYARAAWWFMALGTGWLGWALWRACGGELGSRRPGKAFWMIAAAAAAGTALLHAHEKHEFKIFSDELVLLGISMRMHHFREASVPTRAYHLAAGFTEFDPIVDKRPPLFPFLVCLMHDMTGCRPGNSFAVNFLLTPVLLFLSFRLGRRLGGSWGGAAAALLWLTVPQLAKSACGGGMEMLNLVLLAGCLLAGMRYLEEPDERRLSVLVLCAVLLANARYESALFIAPAGLAAVWGWRKAGRLIIPPALLVCPWMMLPYLWLLNLPKVNPDVWQGFLKKGYERAFSLDYAGENAGHALAHFLDFGGGQPSSPFVFIAGGVALVFFLVHFTVRPRLARRAGAPEKILLLFAPFFLLLFAVILCFNYGQLDKLITQRLALPFYLPLIGCLAWGVYGASRRLAFQRFFTGCIVLFIILYTLPVTSRRPYSTRNTGAQSVAWARRFIREHPGRDYLMIADAPILWITHGVESVSIARANRRLPRLRWFHEQMPFRKILVFQRGIKDPGAQTIRWLDLSCPSPRMRLEPLETHNFGGRGFVRVSRLTGFGGPPLPVFSPSRKDAADWGAILP